MGGATAPGNDYRRCVAHTIRDAQAIEQRLLELAYTTDTKLTATALAYFAPCAIADAAGVLEDLAARGQLTMDVDDDGAISYAMPGRQKLASQPRALAPAVLPPKRAASPTLAAVLSAFVPGAGHAYTGHAVSAVLWFLVVGMGYALVVPGLLLHVWCMVSAARKARPALAAGPRMLMLA
jgi:hypothetical protein